MSEAKSHQLTELLRGLDAAETAARLEELNNESQALRVLLRSARARQRAADGASRAEGHPK